MNGLDEKNILDVSRGLRKAEPQILRGCLAHELAHIAKERKMGSLRSYFDTKLYNTFAKYQTKDERETDMDVIKRGFAVDLLAFVKYADKRREKYTKDDGLTKKEIKQFLNRDSKV